MNDQQSTASQPPIELAQQDKQAITEQPGSHAGMDLSQDARTPPEEPELHLRGGEACPGRFCFIIPCPLPCNFCVFPCPC